MSRGWGPLRITLVASASVGCGREWRRHVWCALQSPEQGGGGGKELRATLARWLHSSPWRKWGLHAVMRYTRTVFPVGWQGHLESKDYSLLMCEEKKKKPFFFSFLFQTLWRDNQTRFIGPENTVVSGQSSNQVLRRHWWLIQLSPGSRCPSVSGLTKFLKLTRFWSWSLSDLTLIFRNLTVLTWEMRRGLDLICL